MFKVIMVSDIVEANGKTVRENNMERVHTIPLGTLVEITGDVAEQKGIRLYVVSHDRDCDGTPLYGLSYNVDAQKELDEFEAAAKQGDYAAAACVYTTQGQITRGYSDHALVVIDKEALTVADYEEVLADKKRLTAELGRLLMGHHAPEQPSLVDLVAYVRDCRKRRISV